MRKLAAFLVLGESQSITLETSSATVSRGGVARDCRWVWESLVLPGREAAELFGNIEVGEERSYFVLSGYPSNLAGPQAVRCFSSLQV